MEWLVRVKYEFSRTERPRPGEVLSRPRWVWLGWLERRDACEVEVPRQDSRLQDSELLEFGKVSHWL